MRHSSIILSKHLKPFCDSIKHLMVVAKAVHFMTYFLEQMMVFFQIEFHFLLVSFPNVLYQRSTIIDIQKLSTITNTHNWCLFGQTINYRLNKVESNIRFFVQIALGVFLFVLFWVYISSPCDHKALQFLD